MRARIYQNYSNGLYFGQIYNEEKEKWEYKTDGCFTKFGAKLKLKRWKNQNCLPDIKVKQIKEFDL